MYTRSVGNQTLELVVHASVTLRQVSHLIDVWTFLTFQSKKGWLSYVQLTRIAWKNTLIFEAEFLFTN